MIKCNSSKTCLVPILLIKKAIFADKFSLNLFFSWCEHLSTKLFSACKRSFQTVKFINAINDMNKSVKKGWLSAVCFHDCSVSRFFLCRTIEFAAAMEICLTGWWGDVAIRVDYEFLYGLKVTNRDLTKQIQYRGFRLAWICVSMLCKFK